LREPAYNGWDFALLLHSSVKSTAVDCKRFLILTSEPVANLGKVASLNGFGLIARDAIS
jgi:hypothetical protein